MNNQDGFRTKVLVTIAIHFIPTITKLMKRIDDSRCTYLSNFSHSSKEQKKEKNFITDKVIILVLSQ